MKSSASKRLPVLATVLSLLAVFPGSASGACLSSGGGGGITDTKSLVAHKLDREKLRGDVALGYQLADELGDAGLHKKAARGGARYTRVPLSWDSVEQTQGDRDWTRYDEDYRAAVRAGARPIFALYNSPAWARSQCEDASGWSYPPGRSHLHDWAEFARAAAFRYPRAVFQIWNEPNSAYFFHPTPSPAEYMRLLRVAYRAIKGVDPKLTVITGGLAPSISGESYYRAWLRALRKRGVRRVSDGIAVHVHPVANPSVSRARRITSMLRRTRRIMGRRERLWLTEVSAPLLGQRRQARLVRRMYRFASRFPRVQAFIYYRLIDDQGRWWGDWISGALASTGAPKRVFRALRRG